MKKISISIYNITIRGGGQKWKTSPFSIINNKAENYIGDKNVNCLDALKTHIFLQEK